MGKTVLRKRAIKRNAINHCRGAGKTRDTDYTIRHNVKRDMITYLTAPKENVN